MTPTEPRPLCRISIVIPVLNEEETINRCLENLLEQTAAGDEIIVVDGSPEGGTLSAIGPAFTERYWGLLAAKGRSRQMNAGAAAAGGDVLLFHHADSRLPAGALAAIRSLLADPRLDGGAFAILLDSRRPFLRFLSAFGTLRSRVTRVPFGDQSPFLRTSVFRRLGGYLPIPLMEDVDLMERLRKAGHRIRILPLAVVSSARRFEKEGPFRCALKDLSLYLLFHAGIPAERLKLRYPDHAEVPG